MASAIVLVIVFVLDVVAFALAVVAEQKRNDGVFTSHRDQPYCTYSEASHLGGAAFLILLVSQAVTMAASRCLCCGRGLKPGGSRACAIILFILSWLAFLIAEICLLAGASKKGYYPTTTGQAQNISCQTLRKGIFGAAAAFIVFTGITSEFYYVSYSKASNFFTPPYVGDHTTGVTMNPL